MKVLLIGGASNTGKSNAVTVCANYLVNKGFSILDCRNYSGKKISLPRIATENKPSTDFLSNLSGVHKNGKKVTVLLTSASDTSDILDANFNYIQNQNCDFFITSIRDFGSVRKYLFSKLNINTENRSFIEFSLAKMLRKNENWFTANKWYDSDVQKMLEFILSSKLLEI